MHKLHLVQLNIAQMKAEFDDPIMKDFVENPDGINSIADNSPGFVWRLQTDEGDATELRVFDNNMLLVHMSVWDSVDSLKKFVYESFHLVILKRKQEWFDKFDGVFQVMWRIEADTIPGIEEVKGRLAYLQQHGESQFAFNFRKSFAPSTQHQVLPVK